MKADYSYYDELYFQDGSPSSETCRELAQTIATVFRHVPCGPHYRARLGLGVRSLGLVVRSLSRE